MSWSIRRAPVVWFLVVASACATPASACATPASPTEMPDAPAGGGGMSAIASTIVQLTNAERSNAGLPALKTSSRLMEAAQLHADQMARLGRLEHVLSGGQYPRPEDRLAAAGYQWSAYAENIAMGQSTRCRGDGFVDALLRSPRQHPEHQRDGDRDWLRAAIPPADPTTCKCSEDPDSLRSPVSGLRSSVSV